MKSSSSIRILLLITLNVALNHACVSSSNKQHPVEITDNVEPFKCDENKSIHWANYCDGVKDCEDGSDEEKCATGESTNFGTFFNAYYVFKLSESTLINDENYGIKTIKNEKVEGFVMESNPNIKFLPLSPASKFPNLKTFIANNCEIKKVSKANLRNLRSLVELELSDNLFIEIESDAFDDLIELKELEIKFTRLSTVDKNWFKNLRNLLELIIKVNRISSLDDGVFDNLKELTDINLSGNDLTTLPPHLFHYNKKLKRIYLDYNKITEIPENLFDGLNQLESLEICNNKISNLPPNLFKDSMKLREFLISHNNLKILPQGLFESNKNLVKIWLQINKIEKIDEGIFDGLKELKHVDLRENKCIDKDYSNSAEFKKIKNDLKVKCG